MVNPTNVELTAAMTRFALKIPAVKSAVYAPKQEPITVTIVSIGLQFPWRYDAGTQQLTISSYVPQAIAKAITAKLKNRKREWKVFTWYWLGVTPEDILNLGSN